MKNFAKNGPEGEGLQDPSKRLFGKALVAGAVVATVGLGVNKYMEEEELNTLFNSFKGQEKSFEKAEEAATLLIEEMKKAGIKGVKLAGNHPNNRIEILRSFLTKHIDSQIGNKYPFKNDLIISGYYTAENLNAIRSDANLLSLGIDVKHRHNKNTEEENMDILIQSLNGQEGNYKKVVEVAKILFQRMFAEGIVSISSAGTYGKHEDLQVLSRFLRNHLLSEAGSKYHFNESFRDSFVFTRESLIVIIGEASLLAEKKK